MVYKSCKKVFESKLIDKIYHDVEQLNYQLSEKNIALEKTIKELQLQSNATQVKHNQLENILFEK